MPRLVRKLISVFVVAMLATVAVYGSYLPMRKSWLFHQAVQNMGTVHTPAAFEALLTAPLNAPSPIGQGEIVRDTAALVLTLIQKEGTPPAVSAELVNFVNASFVPILQRGKGMAFVQTLYNTGATNVIAYTMTNNPTYLKAAENLFLRGQKMSPGRPEFLYGLLDIYRIAGDTENVKAAADRILKLWPDDQDTRAAVAEYLAQPR